MVVYNYLVRRRNGCTLNQKAPTHTVVQVEDISEPVALTYNYWYAST